MASSSAAAGPASASADVARSSLLVGNIQVVVSFEGPGAADLLSLWRASGREDHFTDDVRETLALLGPGGDRRAAGETTDELASGTSLATAGPQPATARPAVVVATRPPPPPSMPAFVEQWQGPQGGGRVPEWRLARAAFAGRAARPVFLEQRRTPLPTPAPDGPLPPPCVWVVLRGREAGGEGIYYSWRAAAVHVSIDGLVPPRATARQSGVGSSHRELCSTRGPRRPSFTTSCVQQQGACRERHGLLHAGSYAPA